MIVVFLFLCSALFCNEIMKRGIYMFYVISFGENDFLSYQYVKKSNIVIITHCLFCAKRWLSVAGVYRAAMHLPETFRDWVVIYKMDTDENHIPKVVCRWNLKAFFTYEVSEV